MSRPHPFQLHFSARAGRRFCSYLRRTLPESVALIRGAPKEISIAMVGDVTMSQLHEKFLGIPGPTDVLTFELDHDARGRVTVGEVIVCVPQARREAKRRKIDVRHELLLYAIHGVLHLSGYDDRTPADHRRMHRQEDEILKRIGIGPVFSPR